MISERQEKIEELYKELILTFGYGLNQKTGDLSVNAKDRVDKSVQIFKDGYSPRIAMSDGAGAKRMKDYAISQGVGEDHILLEDQSTTTEENIVFTRDRYMVPKNWRSLYMVSNYWHGKRITDVLAPKLLKNYVYKFVPAPDNRPDDDQQKLKDIKDEELKIKLERLPTWAKRGLKKLSGA